MDAHPAKTPSFQERVLGIVRAIPCGTTLTYRDVAVLAGHPKAARAVGAILRKNFDPNIPCHRVIRTDGTLGGYNRGEQNKRELLRTEGALSDPQ